VDQRTRGNADFMAVKVEVDVHERSLYERQRDVNLEK
jgi:hypothetical protein